MLFHSSGNEKRKEDGVRWTGECERQRLESVHWQQHETGTNKNTIIAREVWRIRHDW